MLSRLLLLSSFLCFIISAPVEAQQFQMVAETESYTDYELVNNSLELLSPFAFTVPVINDGPAYEIIEQSVATIYKPVSEKRAMVLSLAALNDPLIAASEPAISRGKRVSSVSINISRVGNDQAKIVRYLKIRIYNAEETAPSVSSAKLNTTSPFSNGTWYKIPITENAIYEIDRQYLEDLGISTGSMDPRNIQIWGTNGYALPERNDLPRAELTQIPILVEGEDDGSFDADDRILFYANGPHQVIREGEHFAHRLHPYSNERYIFITVGSEEGIRLAPENSASNPTRTISTFTDFIWLDEELNKPEESLKSGRYWLGERFEATSNGNTRVILQESRNGLAENQEIRVSGVLASRSTGSTSFVISANNTQAATVNIPTISEYVGSEGWSARNRPFTETVPVQIQDGEVIIEATYRHNESNSTGFVDWIRIEAERSLTAEEGQLIFYPPAANSQNEVVTYSLSGFSDQPIVMDVTTVTQPKLLPVRSSGDNFQIDYFTSDTLKIIAQSVFEAPSPGERVETQNLRGLANYPDYIIVTSDEFLNNAEQLASYRQNNDDLTPIVVTQEQIFNEFSGGAVDPVAIRDYVKFLYDRALQNGQQIPRYLLFFGDATFDYKNILNSEFQNHVVTYQSEESLHRTSTYATDDFFGFLDDNEGDMGSGYTGSTQLLDIGIGRISAQTSAEAATAIQKIKRYENPENDGPWQNLFTFAADDDFPNVEDNRDMHTLNADETANLMDVVEPGIRINKIYELSYPEEISSSGRTIPGATEDFIESINNGTLVINYSGHGNEQVLSDENLFTSDLIPMLTNRENLTVLVTATCQFGRYDDIAAQSGAEKLVFAENGGAIAAFTTTRVVYTSGGFAAGNNFGLNIALSQQMLQKKANGEPLRFGDIYLNAKNTYINGNLVVSTINSKKFILIGDPAAKFQIPEHAASLADIEVSNEMPQDSLITIRALDEVNLTGQITNALGDPIQNFNGEATITVFDASRSVSLPTGREWVAENRCYMKNRQGIEDCHYEVETDVLFKGKATVQNGAFSSTFIVPKDISYSDNTGRIVFFAEGNNGTASGSFADVKFSGINPNAVDDGKGPEMDVFLNDQRFVNGNLVSDSPKLIIELKDQSGINTTGTGVGHEIIATIDTKPQQSIVLNEYYEGDVNNYSEGRIEYPLDNLPEGSYTLKVRAWDVHNNPSEKEIFFEVASGDELKIRNVFNYPNPMHNVTRFTFEHNQPGNPLEVSVRIFTLSGKPVQHIQEELITTSSYASISWDGRDRDYDRLANGTYIYVLRVTANTPKGRQTAEKVEKLVIIR